MPRYLQSSIDEVLRRSDLVEIASTYVTLRRNGNDYIGLCPFHREKTPSFRITTDKQLFYCFGCGSGGNLIDFIKKIENLDFVDSIKFLADRCGVTLEEEIYSPAVQKQHETRERILKMNKLAAKKYVANLSLPEAKHAQDYALGRRLNRETLTKFGIGYAKDTWSDLLDHLRENGFQNDEIVAAGLAVRNEKGNVYDKFRNRLMFPIIDVRGNVIAFSGRALDDSPAKYMNSPETPVYHKGDHLFGLNIAKQTSMNDGLILVEGNLDAVSLHAHGFPNAVAGLGTALTENQASLIRRYASSVYVCYDSDEAGLKAADKAIELLTNAGVKLKVISYSGAKDPDEYLKLKGVESFKELLKSALSATEYKILKVRKNYNLVSSQDKVDFIEQAAQILAKNTNAVEREIFIKRIAKETDISSDSILAQVNKCIYNQNRKEYKKAARNVQNVKTPQAQPISRSSSSQKPTSTASYKTEQMLLNLMFFHNNAFRIANASITAEELTDERHKALFTAVTEFKKESESSDASLFFAGLPEELKSLAAQIFFKEYLGDAGKAIQDNIEKLKTENRNRLISRLISEGKLDEVNELIKKENERRNKRD